MEELAEGHVEHEEGDDTEMEDRIEELDGQSRDGGNDTQKEEASEKRSVRSA